MTNPYTGQTMTCSVIDCPMCDGEKYLKNVDVVTRWVQDAGHWELRTVSTRQACPMVPYHSAFFQGGSACPFCQGTDAYNRLTSQWVWVRDD